MSNTEFELNLETIGQVDGGKAGQIIERELGRAADDVDQWGDDKKTRKVLIQVEFSKRADGLIEVEVAAQAKLPTQRTVPTITRAVRKGAGVKLLFEDWEGEKESA